MVLSAHDAEEATRQLEGRVLDAAEAVGEARKAFQADENGSTGNDLINKLEVLRNRQSELIAELNDLVRRALQ